MIQRFLQRTKDVLEYLGGVTEELPAPSLQWMKSPIWWGLWWAALILLMLAFSGQTSKFIYIDF